MLAVAIHADHVFVTELERQLVAGLDAASESQVMRKAKHSGAGVFCPRVSIVARRIVGHQHRNSRHYLIHFADHVAHGALFIEGWDQDHELARLSCPLHNSATRRGLMENRRINRWNCLV